MQRDCIQIQILQNQIPHMQERHIQTTVNTENQHPSQWQVQNESISGIQLLRVGSGPGLYHTTVPQLTFVLCPGIPLHMCSDGVEEQQSCQSGEWLTFWWFLCFKQLTRRRQWIENAGSNLVGTTQKSFQDKSHGIPLHAYVKRPFGNNKTENANTLLYL